jgi:copper homeostasis protein
MTGSLLEVVTLDVRDAVAAEAGGADRVEVVADPSADGRTPEAATVAAIAKECALPQMVLLRPGARPGHTVTQAELEELRARARELADAGAAGFVFGFLTEDGAVDLAATEALIGAVAPLPWTFHRAVDQAADIQAAWRAVRLLPNLATIRTAGAATGVEDGLPVLRTRAGAGDGPLIMAGGGLERRHVPILRDYGVHAFHVAGAVRTSWSDPVETRLVRQWRELLDR